MRILFTVLFVVMICYATALHRLSTTRFETSQDTAQDTTLSQPQVSQWEEIVNTYITHFISLFNC